MEGKREKKDTIQTAFSGQQKVFKFHNVSKDVILGTRKGKKDERKIAKKLPPDKLLKNIEESQEKIAQLILKQYIPIKQKSHSLVNAKTKRPIDKGTKKSTGQNVAFKEQRNPDQMHKQATQPNTKEQVKEEKTTGLRLVDISLLKDPKDKQEFSQDNVHKDDEDYDSGLQKKLWTTTYQNFDADVPLDLSIKSKMETNSPIESLPLDLSKYKDATEDVSYSLPGDPPPLMLIESKNKTACPFSQDTPSRPDTRENVIKLQNEIVVCPMRKSRILTVDGSQIEERNIQQPSLIPQLMKLQPIQVILPENRDLPANGNLILTDSQIDSKKVDLAGYNTKEIIRSKLNERSQTRFINATQVKEENTSKRNLIQPIQMVFTNGKFVQVLPKSKDDESNITAESPMDPKDDLLTTRSVQVVKNPRKRKKTNNVSQSTSTLTNLLEPLSIKAQHKSDGLLVINTYESSGQLSNPSNNNITNKTKSFHTTYGSNNSTTVSSANESMVKTNELVTSNGDLFCTFKNFSKMRASKAKSRVNKKRVQNSSPGTSS